MQKLYYSAVAYTVLGLIGGLYYRELTKTHDFTGATQLSVVHTHLLTLGTLFFLIVLLLEKVFTLSASHWFTPFFYTYHAGLITTVTLLAVHGTLTVLGQDAGPLVATLAGFGHIGLTTGLGLFLLALGERIRPAPDSA